MRKKLFGPRGKNIRWGSYRGTEWGGGFSVRNDDKLGAPKRAVSQSPPLRGPSILRWRSRGSYDSLKVRSFSLFILLEWISNSTASLISRSV